MFATTTLDRLIRHLNIVPAQISLLKYAMRRLEEFDTQENTNYVNLIEEKLTLLDIISQLENDFESNYFPELKKQSSTTTTITSPTTDTTTTTPTTTVAEDEINLMNALSTLRNQGYKDIEFTEDVKISFYSPIDNQTSEQDEIRFKNKEILRKQKFASLQQILRYLESFGFYWRQQGRIMRG